MTDLHTAAVARVFVRKESDPGFARAQKVAYAALVIAAREAIPSLSPGDDYYNHLRMLSNGFWPDDDGYERDIVRRAFELVSDLIWDRMLKGQPVVPELWAGEELLLHSLMWPEDPSLEDTE